MKTNGIAGVNATHDLDALAGSLRSREDFVAFAEALAADARHNPNEWENRDLASFLEALAGWSADMEGYFKNRGEPMPDPPTWNVLGKMLLAARVYE